MISIDGSDFTNKLSNPQLQTPKPPPNIKTIKNINKNIKKTSKSKIKIEFRLNFKLVKPRCQQVK